MILPPFDHSQAHWDRFRAFYVARDGTHAPYGSLIQFASGEFVCDYYRAPLGCRRYYPSLGIGLWSTADWKCPALYYDREGKEKIPTAHLTQDGGQHILADYTSGVAVGLRNDSSIRKFIPEWIRSHARVYFAGMDSEPIGGTLNVSAPKEWPAEDRAHFRMLKNCAKVWLALLEIKCRRDDGGIQIPGEKPWHGPVYRSGVLGKTFAEMDTPTRAVIALLPWREERVTTTVERLYIHPDQKLDKRNVS